MSFWLRFYVPAAATEVTDINGKPLEEPFWTPQVLSYQGDSRAFIAQVFPIPGYDEPTIHRKPLPLNFRLDEPDGISENIGGVPMYWVAAGDVAKLEFEADEEVCSLDKAMMAYIRALPPDHPLIPYVIF